MTLPSRIDLANQTEDEYVKSIIDRLWSIQFHILFSSLQNAAENVRDSQPEDMERNTRSFESACRNVAELLGLAPELAKDESDKPIGRMKCVKCELITNEKVCPDCGGTEFRQMEPGEHGWL